MSDSQRSSSTQPISISPSGSSHSFWEKISQSLPTRFSSSSTPPASPTGQSPPPMDQRKKSMEWDRFNRKKSFIMEASGCGW